MTPDASSDVEQLAARCTAKERAFVAEYVVDMNATQAVLRCGCFNVMPENAATQGTRMMSRPHVKAAVSMAVAQRESRTKMTADSVLHEMSLLSHSSIDHYVIDDKGQVELAAGAPDGAMRAIKSIKRRTTIKEGRGENAEVTIVYDVELTLWDKPEPLKLMGRNAALFPNKVEVTGPNGGPVETVTKIERTIVRPAAQPVTSDVSTADPID